MKNMSFLAGMFFGGSLLILFLALAMQLSSVGGQWSAFLGGTTLILMFIGLAFGMVVVSVWLWP